MKERTIEIGYVIHPDFQGHGYATEAVRAVIAQLKVMGFQKVIAGFFDVNHTSRRVMEKCGMQPFDRVTEIEYRGVRHQCHFYEVCW